MSLPEYKFAEIADEFDKIKAVLVKVSPFLASITRKVRIIITEKVPTAGISQDGILLINPTFWDTLNFQEHTWIISHEIFHIAFLDHLRQDERDSKRWNIVTDAANNKILETMVGIPSKIKEFCVTVRKIYDECRVKLDKKGSSYEDIDRMSKEELYRIIPWEAVMSQCAGDLTDGQGLTGDKEGEGGIGGKELQEGDKEFYDQNNTREDMEDKWKKAITDAYVTQKMAGKVPAGLQRAVDDLLNPKINWRNLLRQEMASGMGRTIVGTYTRLSRKNEVFPGIKKFTMPTVHVLVDTSGSIGGDEIKQVLSEIYSIAKMTKVTVECWDSRAYGRIEANSQSQVISKVVGKLRGGGGTNVIPALQSVLTAIKPLDLVCIFTDGHIYDIDQPEATILFSKIARRTSRSIFAWTSRKHDIPRWKSIEVDIERK